LKIRILRHIIFAILTISVYQRLENTQIGLKDRVSMIFFFLAFLGMGTLSYVPALILDRELFLRERASGMYRVSVYWLSQFFNELPWAFLGALISSTVIYWVTGLNMQFIRFVYWTDVIFLNIMLSLSLAFTTASYVGDLNQATAIIPLVLSLLLLFAGFFIHPDFIPKYWIWMYYISYFRWIFQGLVANDLRGLTFRCQPSEYIPVGNGTLLCPVTTGEEALISLGFNHVNTLENILIIIGINFILSLLGYIGLRFVKHQKK